MTTDDELQPDPSGGTPLTPTRIFLRGLAVTLPAILTVVILIWVAQGINDYIIQPATWIVKVTVAQVLDQSVPSTQLVSIEAAPPLHYCGSDYLVTKELRERYRRFLATHPGPTRQPDAADQSVPESTVSPKSRVEWMQIKAETTPSEVYVRLGPKAVPYPVYAEVARNLPPGQVPQSARGVYMEFVAEKSSSFIPLSVLSVLLIVVMLYFIGRFVSVRIGSWVVTKFEEQVLGRVPVISNVYGGVKQVTDFVFTENQPVEYRRVVAVQYPRKGIWMIGFATGESMLEIAVGAREPCVAVLMPTSPMPVTGFTINVPKSEVLDLDLTVEQAMQFCISCGVLSPPHQKVTRETLQRLIRTGVMKHDGESFDQEPPPSDASSPRDAHRIPHSDTTTVGNSGPRHDDGE
jgi:uncharacterized membrane protein